MKDLLIESDSLRAELRRWKEREGFASVAGEKLPTWFLSVPLCVPLLRVPLKHLPLQRRVPRQASGLTFHVG